MQSDSQNPTLANRLVSIGLSESYASQLMNGRRAPSLALALRIERELGVPVSHWAQQSQTAPEAAE